ncbi:17595_t:CDS:1, partial [Gigaspora margarita]
AETKNEETSAVFMDRGIIHFKIRSLMEVRTICQIFILNSLVDQ